MLKIRFSVFFLFVFICHVTYGQKSKTHVLTADEAKIVKKDAGTLFTSTDYRGALPAYLELYKVDPQNVEYNYRLGYCYLVTSTNRRAALKHLEFAIQSKEIKNEWFFYLGLAYMYNEKWNEAIQAFNDYKKAGSNKAIKDFLPPDRLIEMCENGKELVEHPVNCRITNLGKSINTTFEEYNPYISADGRNLIFTSRRKGNAGGFIEDLGIFTADVYWSVWRDTIWSKARSTGANLNTNWDEETVGLSPAGDQAVIYFDNEVSFGDVGVANLKGKMWQKPVILPTEINSKDIENSACFSADGSMIIFSSNRKDGLGGKDLWMCKKENGNYTKAVNLGNQINTSYDEINPFLSLDGTRLYFSSKGWNSMGDFDIFYSLWNENNNQWSKPVNLGFPINNADENSTISFTGDNRFAYISGSRPNGLGDKDIYKVEFLDTLNHPFSNFIFGTVSSSGGRFELKKISLQDQRNGTTKDILPSGASNQFVIPVTSGEYTLNIEALNCKLYSDTTLVGNSFPPVPVYKKIELQSAK